MAKLRNFLKQRFDFSYPFLSRLTFFIFFFVFSLNVFSQNQTILNGVVTDAKSRETLIGASIRIKGTSKGSVTDVNGEFKLITEKKLPLTLIVSNIGYRAQEIDVYENETLKINLSEDVNQLSAVVVIGYGTQKRSEFTGSVSSIPTELKGLTVSSPDRLIQGAVSGAQVTQSSGQPGGGVSIRVRGGTSINAGNEPLYVIDGFPVYNGDASIDAGVTSGPTINPLSSLNPADIESIDVLKDASSTAIYGSRGANGVILVTTKAGKKGSSSVTYDAYYGVQRVAKKIALLNASQWGSLKNDALKDSGKSPLYAQDQLDQLGEGTDWQASAFRDAPIQSHSLSISSGTDKTRILLSGNYFKQDGIIINTGFDRYSGKLNLDHDVNKKFKLGVYLNGSVTHADVAPSGIVQNILAMVPAVSIRDANGNFTSNSSYGTTVANPIATLSQQINETNTTRFLLNSFGEYKIIEGLTAKVSLGTDIINNKQNKYTPSTLYESSTGGIASIGSLNTINWLNENTLNFKKTFGDKHSVDIIIGNTQQHSRTEAFSAGSSNFVSDAFTYNNIGSGTILSTPSSSSTVWTLQSYLARINYGFNDRYLLTITTRADGSSRFGKNNKWGTFPSAAIAWNASNEKFLKNIKQISSLKVRLSAGLTGNQEIDPYKSLARLSNYKYTIANTLVNGFATSSFANPDLTWEKTAQYDLGLDLALFSDRIQLTSDVYYKKTSDLLLEVPVPFSSGLSSAFQNCGSVENKGIEIGLKTLNLTGKFEWTTNFVFSTNLNKVLSLGGTDYFIVTDPSNSNWPTQIVKVGEALGSFFVYETDGLDAKGNQKYKDLNGDGVITQAGDRKVVGSSQPKFLASISNTFRYRNFDLSIFLNSSYGNKIFNWTRANLDSGSGYIGAIADLLNRWTTTNTNTTVHKAAENPSVTMSDRYIDNGSYLRLKNISLGYSFSKKLLSKVKFKAVRVYVSGSNLLTWTKYTGYDPEVSSNGQNTTSSGNDTGAYPTAKSIIGGISITF